MKGYAKKANPYKRLRKKSKSVQLGYVKKANGYVKRARGYEKRASRALVT